MGLKCTSSTQVEITYDTLVEFIKKRLEGTDKDVGDDIKFSVAGADPDPDRQGTIVLEVDAEHPLIASFKETSEV